MTPFIMTCVVALILAGVRFVFIAYGTLDLAPDEAQYWDWSRHMDWSYYSKGPLVAWLIWLSTHLLGQTEIAVRFFAVLGQGVLSLLGYKTAEKLAPAHKTTAGVLMFAALQVTPLFGAGGIIMSPDIPATLGWAAALWVLAGVDWRQPGQWGRFVAIGVLIGAAGLGKYTAGLFYPLLGLYLLADTQRRTWFLKPQIYVAGVLSLVCMVPVVAWNMAHGWASLHHVIGQAEGESRFAWYELLGHFAGGQALVIGPALFVCMVLFFAKGWRQKPLALAWWFSVPAFVFFLWKGLGAKIQPNWPVLCVYGGLLGVAVMGAVPGWWRRSVVAGLVLAGVLTVPLHDTFLLREAGLKISIKHDPLKDLWGWEAIGHQLHHIMRETGTQVVLTTRYQTAGPVGFYTPEQPQVLYVNPGYRRRNQYDYWSWPDLQGQNLLYVRESQGEVYIEPQIAAAFDNCMFVEKLQAKRNEYIVRQLSVFFCQGFKGMIRPLSDHF